MPRLQPTPPAIECLCRQTNFCAHQRALNNVIGFTALGGSTAPQGPWTLPPGESMLQLHARTYHRACDPFPTYHERVLINNLAPFFITDTERIAVAHERHLEPCIVNNLQEGLHSRNAWAQPYRSIMLDVLQNADSSRPDACITFESQKRTSRSREWRRHIPSQ